MPGSVTRTYGYDNLGLINSITETIAGSTFSTTFTFDDKGRLKTRTHPTGIVETNSYNSRGYLSAISAGGTEVWHLWDMNERQQITEETYGDYLLSTSGYDNFGYPIYKKAEEFIAAVFKQDYRYSFNTTTGKFSKKFKKYQTLNMMKFTKE